MAKSASGDKSEPSCQEFADKPNMARLWTLGHGDCSVGFSQGKAARLAEKAEQSPLGGPGERAPSEAALGMWPALPQGEMVNGRQ